MLQCVADVDTKGGLFGSPEFDSCVACVADGDVKGESSDTPVVGKKWTDTFGEYGTQISICVTYQHIGRYI